MLERDTLNGGKGDVRGGWGPRTGWSLHEEEILSGWLEGRWQ